MTRQPLHMAIARAKFPDHIQLWLVEVLQWLALLRGTAKVIGNIRLSEARKLTYRGPLTRSRRHASASYASHMVSPTNPSTRIGVVTSKGVTHLRSHLGVARNEDLLISNLYRLWLRRQTIHTVGGVRKPNEDSRHDLHKYKDRDSTGSLWQTAQVVPYQQIDVCRGCPTVLQLVLATVPLYYLQPQAERTHSTDSHACQHDPRGPLL